MYEDLINHYIFVYNVERRDAGDIEYSAVTRIYKIKIVVLMLSMVKFYLIYLQRTILIKKNMILYIFYLLTIIILIV